MKILAFFLLIPAFACADIYKCIEPDGKQYNSDQPCSSSSSQECVEIEERDWVERLRSSVPHGVEILSIKKGDTETTMKYSFATMEHSSRFLKLAAEVSGQRVALIKVIAPVDGKPGSAEMKVSNQMPNIFRD